MRLIPKFLNGSGQWMVINGKKVWVKDGDSVEELMKNHGYNPGGDIVYTESPITKPSGGKEFVDEEENWDTNEPNMYPKLWASKIKEIPSWHQVAKDKTFITPTEENKKKYPNYFQPSGLNSGKIASSPIPVPLNNNKLSGINFLNKLVPNILEAVRLKNTLNTNDRVAKTLLEGIRANQQQPYLTHRLVVGDEATKLAYYRRAIAGQTKAAQPFTSDADRQMAYQMEAKRIGDELKALGDLADNQEIRRTSDESNQHQWANAQRLTDVANYNSLERNKALASRKQIEALKYMADFTSIDNYLMGIQSGFEKKNFRLEAINDEILKYRLQSELLDDPEVIAAKNELDEAVKAKDLLRALLASEKLQRARRNAYLRFLENYRREKYGNGIFISKKGSKLTLKDDLLYKTTKDAVEHFRAMSKMTDDSRVKNKSKKIKLTPHPKGKTKKYLLGGVAPFMIFRPLTMGGEQTIASGGSSESSLSSSEKLSVEEKELLDLVKKLFSDVSSKGLPIDVNMIYKNISNLFLMKKLYGESLTTDDIASMYLTSMLQLSQVQHSKALYDEARKLMVDNKAIGEFAVSANGNYFAQNKEGKILEASLLQIQELGLNPLTNGQLLFMRETNPTLSFGNGDYIIGQAANSSVSIPMISDYILKLAGTLSGTSDASIEGLTKVEAGKVKAGLEMLTEAPEGYYSVESYSKSNRELIRAALDYIENMLPNNYKAIMDLHVIKGDTGANSRQQIIMNMLKGKYISSTKVNVNPLSGKAATSKEGKSTEGDIKSNFLDLVQRDLIGVSRPFLLITKDGNTMLYSLNSKYISLIPNVTEDMSIEKMLAVSKLGTIMDSRLGVTFGDLVIAPENFRDIMFDPGSGATIVTLPCKYLNGHKIVNFAIKDEYDNAVKEVSKTIPINYNDPNFILALANKLHEKGLDSLLKGDNLDPNMFGHFIVVGAYTTDRVKFDTNSKYIEKVKNPDKALEERLSRGLSTNNDKNDYEIDIDDTFGWFEGTWDDIYRGQIFIPLNNDPVSALTGWGNDVKLDEARDLSELYLNFLKSSKQKESSSSVL